MAGSTEAAQFHDYSETKAARSEPYDDGLVHGHAWATEPAK
jgi:hypothetical protein